jgi:acyl-CoA thioesterase-2
MADRADSSDDAALTSFGALLDVDELDDNLYRGLCHAGAPLRAFGGQVAAQALVAAGATVSGERPVHSLHGYFIRPGRPDRHIVYQVDRVRDGRSFTTRRVTAVQRGQAIFTLSASFQVREGESVHQAAMPDVPPPDEIEETQLHAPGTSPLQARIRPLLDARPVPVEPDDGVPATRFWVRVREHLPDDPLHHACALTYISDLRLARTASATHRAAFENVMVASLDHAVWFHRDFRADDWLLADLRSPTAGFGRGLAYGGVYTQGGQLVASVVQEIVVRARGITP